MKKSIKSAILSMLALICVFACPKTANFARGAEDGTDALKIEAKSAYLIDANTKTVIYAKDESNRLPVASMTKLATLAVIFDKIDSGNLSLNEMVTVSQNASDTEGSSAFLDAGSKYSVEDLIKTIIIVSANDSCVALAEHICGSEELFVNQMNSVVKTLNLQNTHFENATGLPQQNHYSSAKDIAQIYSTICNNEIYKKFSKIWMEDFIHPSGRKTGLVNTNRLVKTYDGCTGGKTGHTNEAKYCLTASAQRNGTTLISVIIGANDSKTRFAQTQTLFNYGFANYYSKQIVDTSIAVDSVEIVGAKINNIEVFASESYCQFCKKGETPTFSTHLVIDKKIVAPLKSGDKVGTILILDQNNIVQKEIDLVVKQDVDKITYKQILDNIFDKW